MATQNFNLVYPAGVIMKQSLLSVILVMALGTTSASAFECKNEVITQNRFAFSNAYSNLSQFNYVYHSIKKLTERDPSLLTCVEAVALTQTTLQYNKYLFQVSMFSTKTNMVTHKINLLYQDAPIQGYHNAIGLPWVGLKNNDVDTYFSGLIKSSEFEKIATTETDVLKILKSTDKYKYFEKSMDPLTLSSIVVATDSASKTHLITWLSHNSNSNSFDGSYVTAQAMLIKIGSSEVSVANQLSAFTDLLLPLEDLSKSSVPVEKDLDIWIQKLISFSTLN